MPRRDSTALTWAWISFQTIYGELVPLEDNSDVTGLAMFILNRLLWNPDIAAEYRHPSVPHLYRDGGWLCLRHVLPTLCAEGIPSSLLSLSDFTFQRNRCQSPLSPLPSRSAAPAVPLSRLRSSPVGLCACRLSSPPHKWASRPAEVMSGVGCRWLCFSILGP